MRRFHRQLLVAAATVAVLSGCGDAGSDGLLSPAADMITKAAELAQTRSPEQGNRTYGLITGSGGELSINGHRLSVPAGAVAQPTWFLMQVIEANAVHVRLQAWRATDGVAVTQFPTVPVKLVLDASRLEKLDPTGLVIVYLRDGTYSGAKETVVSTVDTTRWTVTGYLSHFSEYALYREFSPGID